MSTKNARITVVSRYSDIEVTILLHYENNIINEILYVASYERQC